MNDIITISLFFILLYVFLGAMIGFICGIIVGYYIWGMALNNGKGIISKTYYANENQDYKKYIALAVTFVWIFGNFYTKFSLDQDIHLIFGAIIGSMFGVEFFKNKNK